MRSRRGWVNSAVGLAVVFAAGAAQAAHVFHPANKRAGHLAVQDRLDHPKYERWFMPGPLGSEPGAAVAGLSPNAYLTRHLVATADADGGEWARRNKLTEALPFSHNLSTIFPPSLFDTHPDYFLEQGGLRMRPQNGVVNWNPDLGNPAVAAYAAEAARGYFDNNPNAVSFAVGVNDGLRFGDSADTLRWIEPPRWFRGRPDFSNLVYQFTNSVAAEVGKTHPDKFIGSLAYYWCEQAPDFPLEPNVLPFLTADRALGYDRAFRREERALQQAWAAKGTKRLGLYDYVYGTGFLIPRIHTALLAENLRAARRLGFTDYFAEFYPNWGLDGPQPWLVAQLLQNPEASRRQLLDEYYRRYFREAATPMRRFFERCEEQWMGQEGEVYWLKHWRNPSQASIFPSPVCAELRALLDEAGSRATSATVRERVALVADSFVVTERLAALVETRNALTNAVLKGGADTATLAAEWRAVRTGFLSALEAVRAKHPAALFPEGVDYYMFDDPSYAAEAGALPDSAAELLIDGSFEGKPMVAGTVAHLTYEASVTKGWVSRTEPAERERSGVREGRGRTGVRAMRFEGATVSRIFQWRPVPVGGSAEVTAWVRGRVGVSSRVQLVLAWLDEHNRLIVSEQSSIGLPEGEWPEWVQLRQGRKTPERAKWVGVGLIAMHQGSEDWVEWDDVSLRASHGN